MFNQKYLLLVQLILHIAHLVTTNVQNETLPRHEHQFNDFTDSAPDNVDKVDDNNNQASQLAAIEARLDAKLNQMAQWQHNNNMVFQQRMDHYEEENTKLKRGIMFYSQMVQMKVTEMEVHYNEAFVFSGFSAQGTEPSIALQHPETLQFSKVITNIGGSYVYEKHFFLCPFDAYYNFHLKVSFQNGKCQLMKDDVVLASSSSYEEDTFIQSSDSVITMCKAGQHVYIQGSPVTEEGEDERKNRTFVYDGINSSFSGYVVASISK